MSFPQGRVAVITGGHGTLAEAIAKCFVESGYIIHAPGRSELDVTAPRSVTRYFEQLNRLDLLINNAGATDDGLSAKLPPERFARTLDVNLSGAQRCTKAALPRMHSGGHIIQIGSRSAWDGKAGQSGYAAAKAALAAFTQSLARELGPAEIRANYVAPGFLETKMTQNMGESAKQEILNRQCLATQNTPEKVAEFLKCLDGMPGVSGQIFQLDSRIMAWT